MSVNPLSSELADERRRDLHRTAAPLLVAVLLLTGAAAVALLAAI